MENILSGTGTAIPAQSHAPTSILSRSERLTALLDRRPGEVHKAACSRLISECSLPSDHPTEDQMTADVAGQFAGQTWVKRLTAIHRYPPAREVDLAGELKRWCPGPVTVAQDRLRLTLGEEAAV